MTDKEKAEDKASNRELILEQGSKYANEHWDVHENPNEHDNAHDDFINGAIWALKNLSACEDKKKDIEELVKLTSEYMDFMYNHSRMSRSMHETWANLHMNLENILNKHKK